MQQAQVRVHVNEDRAGWVVVELVGHFTDEDDRLIAEHLLEHVDDGAVTVVVDVSRLTSITPGQCRSLVAIASSLRGGQGEVLVTRPPPQLRRMLAAEEGADSIRIVADFRSGR